MNVSEMAKKNLILKYPVGSKLYGTDTLTSDTDYSGVFVADESYYLGMFSVDQVDLSEVVKRVDGKNDSSSIDYTVYNIKKFIRLAMDNNPNVLEQLFISKEKLLYYTETGQILLDNREIFPHQGLYQRFTGYAISQKKKMVTKTTHFNILQDVVKYLKTKENYRDKLETLEVEMKTKFNLHIDEIVLDHNYIQRNFVVGDSRVPLDFTIKKAIEVLGNRIRIFSNRQELITRYGYDCKFASHLIRLLDEGIELLETGKIEFPLRNASLLKDIKEGKYSLEEIFIKAEQLEKEVALKLEKTKLPKYPNVEEINSLTIKLIKGGLK